MAKSNKIIPDFTEDMVAFMVQLMLTILRFPRAPLAMIPLSKKEERIFGADVKIESLSPLYIQFKRSFAYPDFTRAKFLKERKNLKLNNSPRVLFFELRKKDKTHKDYQHNILLDLRTKLKNNGTGDAIYAAPLFLNRSAYLLAVHLSSLLNWRPWNIFINHPFIETEFNLYTQNGEIKFNKFPILNEHIAIPPYQKVTTYKHKYSYVETGEETCFHSPVMVEGPKSLGQFIYDFLGFHGGKPSAQLMNIEESLKMLTELHNEYFGAFTEEENNLSIIDKWILLGSKLKLEYDIEQYMLIKFPDDL